MSMQSNRSKVPSPLRNATTILSILAALLTAGIALAGLEKVASHIWLVMGVVLAGVGVYIFSLRSR